MHSSGKRLQAANANTHRTRSSGMISPPPSAPPPSASAAAASSSRDKPPVPSSAPPPPPPPSHSPVASSSPKPLPLPNVAHPLDNYSGDPSPVSEPETKEREEGKSTREEDERHAQEQEEEEEKHSSSDQEDENDFRRDEAYQQSQLGAGAADLNEDDLHNEHADDAEDADLPPRHTPPPSGVEDEGHSQDEGENEVELGAAAQDANASDQMHASNAPTTSPRPIRNVVTGSLVQSAIPTHHSKMVRPPGEVDQGEPYTVDSVVRESLSLSQQNFRDSASSYPRPLRPPQPQRSSSALRDAIAGREGNAHHSPSVQQSQLPLSRPPAYSPLPAIPHSFPPSKDARPTRPPLRRSAPSSPLHSPLPHSSSDVAHLQNLGSRVPVVAQSGVPQVNPALQLSYASAVRSSMRPPPSAFPSPIPLARTVPVPLEVEERFGSSEHDDRDPEIVAQDELVEAKLLQIREDYLDTSLIINATREQTQDVVIPTEIAIVVPADFTDEIPNSDQRLVLPSYPIPLSVTYRHPRGNLAPPIGPNDVVRLPAPPRLDELFTLFDNISALQLHERFTVHGYGDLIMMPDDECPNEFFHRDLFQLCPPGYAYVNAGSEMTPAFLQQGTAA
jgi:hypothetical protein